MPPRAPRPAAHALALLAGLAAAAAGATQSAAADVLVRFQPGVRAADMQAAHAARGAAVRRRFASVPRLHQVSLPAGVAVERALAGYRGDPRVAYAEPNAGIHADLVPDDPLFATQWSLDNVGQTGGLPGADIGAEQAWDVTTGDAGIVVAVLDTGLDYTHPDLAANVFRNEADCDADGVDDDGNGWADDCHGVDAVNDDADPLDDNDHGSHVAGIIGAVGDNAAGIAGVAWDVRILPCKVLDANGDGTLADAIACLDYVRVLRDRGVNVVATNNSWGGPTWSEALRDAVAAHQAAGILCIASAGNLAQDTAQFEQYPASFLLPHVVSVAASDALDGLAWFSNFGRRTVSLAAPGADIPSTVRAGSGTGYDVFSGTSMAAPHVAGVAVLLKAQDPARDWRAIRNLLLAGGGETIGAYLTTVSRRRLSARDALGCTTATVASRLQPAWDDVDTAIGVPVDLAAIHVRCAVPAGPVTVTVTPGGQVVTLADAGIAPDLAAGDGIYAGQFTPTANGDYALAFSTGDTVTVHVGIGLPDPSPTSGKLFGDALAVAGTDVVVGTHTFQRVPAYLFSTVTGTLLREFHDPSPVPGFFGTALATSGTDVLIGARYAGTSSTDLPGAAYVFDLDSGDLRQTLSDPAPVHNGLFGMAVAFVAGNPVVSAPGPGRPDGGVIHVFDRATGAVLRTIARPASNPQQWGFLLASRGTELIVGSLAAAYVYDADPASATFGTLVRTIVGPPGSGFASSIAVVGPWLATGLPSYVPDRPVPPAAYGAVRLFDLATGALVRTIENPLPANVLFNGSIVRDDFGEAVAAVGSGHLLVGAPYALGGRADLYPFDLLETGAAYLYDAATGVLHRTLVEPGPYPNGATFGDAVAAVGDELVIGAPRHRKGTVFAAGAVFVFPPLCGDGIVQASEECDRGAANGDASCCSTACRRTGTDADGDLVCDREDVCPALPDPGQEDTDADDVGDACDLCTTATAGQREWLPASLVLSRNVDGIDGNDRLVVKGRFALPPDAGPLDPLAEGLRLRLLSDAGDFIRSPLLANPLDVVLPGGAYASPGPGWTTKAAGPSWRFVDRRPGGTGGVRVLTLRHAGGGVYDVKLRMVDATIGFRRLPLQVGIVLGGAPSACAEVDLDSPACAVRSGRIRCRR